MTGKRRKLLLVVVTVSCVVAGSAVAVAAGVGFSGPIQTTTDPNAPPPGFIPPTSTAVAALDQGVAAPSNDEQAAFGALGRAATALDTAAATSDAVLGRLATPQREWAVNPSLGRVVFGTSTGQPLLFLAPGNGQVCLVAAWFSDGDSSGCATAASAESEGILLSGYVGQDLGGYTLQGVLPEGATDVIVSRSGASDLDVTLTPDGGLVLSSASKLLAVSFTGQDGTRHTIDLVN